jgi:hypothetical protein
MSKERASITDIDLSGFAPSHPVNGPPPAEIARVAQAADFPSRQTNPAHPARDRAYRTGRTRPIPIKATPDFESRFHALAEVTGVTQVRLFECLVEAMEEKVAALRQQGVDLQREFR